MIIHLCRISILYSLGVFSVALSDSPSSWGYWLSDINPQGVQKSEYDLVVIDFSQDGSTEFGRDDVANMKLRRAKPDRKLVSYFSIGEAENYRYYWKDEWVTHPPDWLDAENTGWEGNYKVRYWHQDWQRILFGNADAYLDKILNAGFDGMYLDIIDAFEYYEPTRPQAEQEMVDLVIALSRYAAEKNPDFLVIIQNGERVLSHEELLPHIDGVAKEDLYFGLEQDHLAAPQHEIDFSLNLLKQAQQEGKFVFLVSYVPHARGQQKVLQASKELGFVSYFSDRELNTLRPNQGFGDRSDGSTSGDVHSSASAIDNLEAGQFRSTVGLEGFSEEADSSRYEESILRYKLEYGYSDQLVVGFDLPMQKTEVSVDMADGAGNDESGSSSGIGNLILFADYASTISTEHKLESLTTFELGLPTGTQSEDFSSGGSINLEFLIERFWERFGLSLKLGSHHFSDEDFKNLQATELFVVGLQYEHSEHWSSYLELIRDDNTKLAELGFGFQLSGRSEIDAFWVVDSESDQKVESLGLSYSFLH